MVFYQLNNVDDKFIIIMSIIFESKSWPSILRTCFVVLLFFGRNYNNWRKDEGVLPKSKLLSNRTHLVLCQSRRELFS
jgi:hypothetical protein